MLLLPRHLRRRLRLMSYLPAGWWLWKQRHVLAGMAAFGRTVPDRMRMGRGGEVALAAKVNLALLRDERLKGADLRVGAVQGADVCLEAGRGSERAAEVARRIVEQIPGVASVRVEDTSAAPAPSVVAGHGEVGEVGELVDLRDGAVDAPTGTGELPVRI
jgi:hypothetical protein